MTAAQERELHILRKALGLSSTEESAFFAHFRLTAHEARMLGALHRAKGQAVSTSRLARGSHRAVAVHVCSLRGKLEHAAIDGDAQGYRLTDLGKAMCAEALHALLEAA